ncbi:FUN14 family-domain-containing protein [Absidia repens]|uniref:FUN14 family-domain-containing protein n=1 Tax=Absidia repens TaxID=90262 RepID=A0A1X2IYC2_9FUNG|nr:FUN14 family-domain-containing protein [Absidia repens]
MERSGFTSWAGPAKMIGAIAGTTGSMVTGLWVKRPLSCQDAKKSLIHKGELSFGIVLGFCSGYLIKKVGKFFALMVGAGFMFLQYLSLNGYITVHWDRMEGGYKKQMGVDKDGKVTTQTIRSKWDAFVGFMTHNLQFKSTFMVGVYAGIHYG